MNNIIDDGINGWNLPLQSNYFVKYSLVCENTMVVYKKRQEISRRACPLFCSDNIDLQFYKKLKLLDLSLKVV
jgi:hypothetical protein